MLNILQNLGLVINWGKIRIITCTKSDLPQCLAGSVVWDVVPITEEAANLKEVKSFLRGWTDSLKLLIGVPFVPPPPHRIVISDAWMEGWTRHMEFNQKVQKLSGLWTKEQRSLHIIVLEITALHTV